MKKKEAYEKAKKESRRTKDSVAVVRGEEPGVYHLADLRYCGDDIEKDIVAVFTCGVYD